MDSIKIVHCGDFHFDSAFSVYGDIVKSESRREDLRGTFSKIISKVKENKTDILLISGDLFDNQHASRNTVSYIIKKFNEIPDTKVLISPGNHDYLSAESYYSLAEWGENVHIFGDSLECCYFKELNTAVYGIGFTNNIHNNSLIETMPDLNYDNFNILLIHGDINGGDYNPISLKQLEGFDYIALGHIHKFSGILYRGRTCYAYPGAPEGRGFDETGEKGVIIGEIGKNINNLQFKSMCSRIYHDISVDMEDACCYDDIVNKIMSSLINHNTERDLYKITLTGSFEQDFTPYAKVIQDKLKDEFFFLKIIDKTVRKFDIEAIKNLPSITGIFVRNMLERHSKNGTLNEEEFEKALYIGIKALNQEKVNII